MDTCDHPARAIEKNVRSLRIMDRWWLVRLKRGGWKKAQYTIGRDVEETNTELFYYLRTFIYIYVLCVWVYRHEYIYIGIHFPGTYIVCVTRSPSPLPCNVYTRLPLPIHVL